MSNNQKESAQKSTKNTYAQYVSTQHTCTHIAEGNIKKVTYKIYTGNYIH